MVKVYFEKYESQENLIKLAAECVSSNPFSKLLSVIEQAQQELNLVNLSGWDDSNGAKFSSLISKVDSNFSLVNNAISSCMAKSDDLYMQLNESLQKLKELDLSYKTLYNSEPIKENYKVVTTDSITNTEIITYPGYASDYSTWESNVINAEKECEALCLQIDSFLEALMAIDGCSIDEESILATMTAVNGILNNGEVVIVNDNQELSDGYIVLSGEELEAFVKDNNIRLLDSLEIRKYTTIINGVAFNEYHVIDLDNYDEEAFESFVSDSNKTLENIDNNVLNYVSNGGTNLVYFSDYTVDNTLYDPVTGEYDGPGDYGGYCNSENRNIISVNNGSNDYEAILHEFGHAFDFTLCYNLTGQTCAGISQTGNANILPKVSDKTFYQVARSDAATMFDPELSGNYTYVEGSYNEVVYGPDTKAVFKDYENKNLDRNGFNSTMGFYETKSGIHIGEFSSYSYEELVHDNEGQALEFFAESFKMYYNPDRDKCDRYGVLLPETYEYFAGLEEMLDDE